MEGGGWTDGMSCTCYRDRGRDRSEQQVKHAIHSRTSL